MVVHFDRLKPYRQSVPTPVKCKKGGSCQRKEDTTPKQLFGAELELVEEELEESLTGSSRDGSCTQECETEQEQNEYQQNTEPEATVRRYPVRTRHPPDFYAKCGTHS